MFLFLRMRNGKKAVALALMASLAWAMYSPEDITKARQDAAFHLEICIERIEPTRTQPGQALIHGRVTQVLRPQTTLKKGDPVSFWVDTRHRGQRSPPGDDVRLDLEEITPGKYLEAHFTANWLVMSGVTQLEVALRQIGVYAVSSSVGRL